MTTTLAMAKRMMLCFLLCHSSSPQASTYARLLVHRENVLVATLGASRYQLKPAPADTLLSPPDRAPPNETLARLPIVLW